MIRHIVTWKFTAQDEESKSADFDRLAEGFGPLPHLIPEIKTLHLGRDVGETVANWDAALIIDFATTADLETYQTHPEHDKVRQIVRAVTVDRSAIDFEL